jgi:hypothetical protein
VVKVEKDFQTKIMILNGRKVRVSIPRKLSTDERLKRLERLEKLFKELVSAG